MGSESLICEPVDGCKALSRCFSEQHPLSRPGCSHPGLLCCSAQSNHERCFPRQPVTCLLKKAGDTESILFYGLQAHWAYFGSGGQVVEAGTDTAEECTKEIWKCEGLWSIVQADQHKALTDHKVPTPTLCRYYDKHYDSGDLVFYEFWTSKTSLCECLISVYHHHYHNRIIGYQQRLESAHYSSVLR